MAHRPAHGLLARRVRGVMGPAPPSVTLSSPCSEVVRLLRTQGAPLVTVSDDGGRLRGIVSAQDVVDRIAFRAPPATPAVEIMSRPAPTVRADDYLVHGVALMHGEGHAALPVVDEVGAVVGLLTRGPALEAALPRAVALVAAMARPLERVELSQVKQAQARLIGVLADEATPVHAQQALLTQLNNDIHQQVVRQAVQALETEGWGAPPVDFDVIVMGSGGRGESFLFPDQDNGFVLDDYPQARRAAVEGYFIELAGRTTDTLARVGFGLCRGHVMAVNPLWRKSLSEWRAQLRQWLARPGTATAQLAGILADFRPIHGSGTLAGALRADLIRAVPAHPRLLEEMQRVQEARGLALGLFRRLLPESSPGPNRGKLNLKHHALLPLVEAVRVLALRSGIAETGTLARLDALGESGELDRDSLDDLRNAFSLVTGLVLRQQVADFKAGEPVGTHVSPARLAARERQRLGDALRAVNRLRDQVRGRFRGQMA